MRKLAAEEKVPLFKGDDEEQFYLRWISLREVRDLAMRFAAATTQDVEDSDDPLERANIAGDNLTLTAEFIVEVAEDKEGRKPALDEVLDSLSPQEASEVVAKVWGG